MIEARKRRRMQPTILALEDRRLLSNIAVTNTASRGTGSLAWAVSQANLNGGAETITFDKTARIRPMRTPFFSFILAVVALTLASASNPSQAGSVTYDFVEGTGAPNPGEIGATITLSSPPATPSSGWTTSVSSDILGLQIIDRAVLFGNGDFFIGTFSNT